MNARVALELRGSRRDIDLRHLARGRFDEKEF